MNGWEVRTETGWGQGDRGTGSETQLRPKGRRLYADVEEEVVVPGTEWGWGGQEVEGGALTRTEGRLQEKGRPT